jgi:hypothetical protein
MTKARKLGFQGYIDTEESLYGIFNRMTKDGVSGRLMIGCWFHGR